MTLIDGTSGFLPRFMWCGRADIPECPAPRSKTSGAPSHSFGGVLKAADITSVRLGSAQCGIAQPRLTLTGQRDDTAGAAFLRFVGTGGRRDGRCMSILDSRKPHAEKVWPRRSRQNKGAAPLTKAPSAFRRIGGAVRQGTLTIIGSNVRLGTEMPVALSSFLI